MTYLEKHGLPGPPRVARRAKRTVVGSVVAALAVVVPAGAASAGSFSSSSPLAGTPSVAGAATVGSTRAEVAALRDQIANQAGRLHGYTSEYSKASTQAQVIGQELHTQRGSLATLRSKLGGTERTLRHSAIQSYTGQGVTDSQASVSVSVDPSVSAEYLTVASGDVSNLEDRYQLDQRRVGSAVSTLSAEQRTNAKALHDAAAARSSALQTAQTEQGNLATLEARLASLQKAATQGGPVNGGLVKSTQTQTGSSAPTAAPKASAPTTTPATTPVTTPSTTPPVTSRPVSSPPATAAPTTSPPTTSPPTTSPPTTSPPTTSPPAAGGGGGSSGVWLQLRECESGNNYKENTGNGFYGAYQFSAGTWTSLGYPGRPDLEPPGMQDAAAQKLQAESGWGQWPACSATLGLH